MINGALILILLVAYSTYNFQVTKRELLSGVDSQISESLERMISSLPSAVWNYESEQMEDIVKSELGGRYTKGILLYDDKGLLFGQTKNENGQGIKTINEVPSNANFRESPLIFEKHEIGKVVLLVDASSAEKKLSRLLMASIIQAIVMLLVLIITSYMLIHKIVLSQVINIRDTLADVTRGDLTKRLKVSSKDEIGEFCQHFNEFILQFHTIVTQITELSTTCVSPLLILVELMYKHRYALMTRRR